MQSAIKISGVIITFNEERHIEACIDSMKEIVDEIVVVDSYSTDKTPEICKKLGVKFIQHSFEGHIEQKNFAMQQTSYDIVLSLDADERVSDQMRASIETVKNNWNAAGYEFNRLNNYCGKWLRFAWYPDRKLRLWDRTKGHWGGTNPHDKVIMATGETQRLKGDILHYAYYSVDEHLQQLTKFARIAAKAKFKKNKKVNFLIHVVLNPWFKFVRKYFFNLGFLDGYYGLIFSIMSAYLNFTKYAILWGLNRKQKKGSVES